MITALQFIVALSLLIVLHEGGHYLFAKLFKTKVEKFYLFFDFFFPFSNILPYSLIKKKIGETVYGIGWFPLGGYVKIAGMVDESMDKEQLKQPPQPWEFRSKPAWQRLLIMLGGIIVNVITALIIYTFVMYVYGEKKLPLSEVNAKGGIEIIDSLGYRLGFQDGDQIVAIDNKQIPYYNNVLEEMIYAKSVQVNRNGEIVDIALPENLIGKIVDNNKDRPFFMFPIPTIVGEVQQGSFAESAGLKSGDVLTAVNGQPTRTFTQFRKALQENSGKSIALTVHRSKTKHISDAINISNESSKAQVLDLQVQVSDTGTLGFRPGVTSLKDLSKMGYYNMEKKEYTFLQSFPAGINQSINRLVSYYNQFKLILNPSTEAYKGLGGFISMGKIYGDTWEWERFWDVTAFLSIILAFMNLLPIPGLDGGYVMFTLWEMLTGRKVNEKVMEYATTVGLILLVILMLYANGNDIIRYLQRE